MILSAFGGPNVWIDDGVNLSDVTFDGYQSWVGGTYGLYWNDTTSAQASLALSVKNVRWEQISGSTGYLLWLKHNTALQQLTVENVYGGLTANGFYLRKVADFSFVNAFYIGALVALDADSSNNNGALNNFHANNPAATVSLSATRVSGKYLISGNTVNLTDAATSSATMAQIWNPSATLGFMQLEPPQISVANNTSIVFSTDVLSGLVFIYAYSGGVVSAVFAVNGANHATKILAVSDTGWWGTTAGGANYNLYWDAGSSRYRLQNNTVTNPVLFYVVAVGHGER
jgi:hypothetical protein